MGILNSSSSLNLSGLVNSFYINNDSTNSELTNSELTNSELTNSELTNRKLTNSELSISPCNKYDINRFDNLECDSEYSSSLEEVGVNNFTNEYDEYLDREGIFATYKVEFFTKSKTRRIIDNI